MARNNSGFTLLEVLASVAILVISILALTGSRTSSLDRTRRSIMTSKAVQLAQEKMTQVELEVQNKLNKGGPKEAFDEASGNFEEPNQDFSFKIVVSEAPFKLEKEQLVKMLEAYGVDPDLAEVQLEESSLIIANLNKAIEENVAQIYVEVSWKEGSSERRLDLVTHLIPEKPKIQLTTDAG